MAIEHKIVEAKGWSELPEILKPGVYIVNGRRYVIKVAVSRDGFVRALQRMSKSAARI